MNKMIQRVGGSFNHGGMNYLTANLIHGVKRQLGGFIKVLTYRNFIIQIVLFIVGFILIGYFISKGKEDAKLKLIELFKFILENEFLTPAGKMNYGFGILLTFSMMSIPLGGALLYQAIFKQQIIDPSLLYYIIKYFTYCAIPLSIIEGLIFWKVYEGKLSK